MGYIFVDREGDGGNIRHQMRRSMRTTNRHDGTMPMMNGGEGWEQGYRMGYKHGWEDSENDMDEEFRRSRDSRGRFV
jgi:hypothetical protein